MPSEVASLGREADFEATLAPRRPSSGRCTRRARVTRSSGCRARLAPQIRSLRTTASAAQREVTRCTLVSTVRYADRLDRRTSRGALWRARDPRGPPAEAARCPRKRLEPRGDLDGQKRSGTNAGSTSSARTASAVAGPRAARAPGPPRRHSRAGGLHRVRAREHDPVVAVVARCAPELGAVLERLDLDERNDGGRPEPLERFSERCRLLARARDDDSPPRERRSATDLSRIRSAPPASASRASRSPTSPSSSSPETRTTCRPSGEATSPSSDTPCFDPLALPQRREQRSPRPARGGTSLGGGRRAPPGRRSRRAARDRARPRHGTAPRARPALAREHRLRLSHSATSPSRPSRGHPRRRARPRRNRPLAPCGSACRRCRGSSRSRGPARWTRSCADRRRLLVPTTAPSGSRSETAHAETRQSRASSRRHTAPTTMPGAILRREVLERMDGEVERAVGKAALELRGEEAPCPPISGSGSPLRCVRSPVGHDRLLGHSNRATRPARSSITRARLAARAASRACRRRPPHRRLGLTVGAASSPNSSRTAPRRRPRHPRPARAGTVGSCMSFLTSVRESGSSWSAVSGSASPSRAARARAPARGSPPPAAEARQQRLDLQLAVPAAEARDLLLDDRLDLRDLREPRGKRVVETGSEVVDVERLTPSMSATARSTSAGTARSTITSGRSARRHRHRTTSARRTGASALVAVTTRSAQASACSRFSSA